MVNKHSHIHGIRFKLYANFVLQELESQLLDLQDKYERLEEECCELEEIENDTRLHWQQ